MMYNSYESYRISGGTPVLKRVIKAVFKIIIILFILYFICSTFFITVYYNQTQAMDPALKKNDMVMACPLVYGTKLWLFNYRIPGLEKPQRGDLAVVIPPYANDDSIFLKIIEPFVRFFTLQKVNIYADSAGKPVANYLIKRIVGLPGDMIKMQDFILYVKPREAEEYLIEFELSAKSYEINRESLEGFYPPTWQEDFPLSGDFEEIKLENNEYFVLGDNRVFSSDSRSWGPIPFDNILSKVIFRYWPLERFGSF